MNKEFEFDKIVLSVALAIFTFIFSQNIGGFFYNTEKIVDIRGYQIPIEDSISQNPQKKGLPEILDLKAIFAAADAESGKSVFAKCAVCHTVDKGGANKVGPNLWNILTRPSASESGFKYSNAMMKRGTDGGSWGYEDLYRYLYAPAQYVIGNKMAFAGIKNDKDRANLIAYLRTLNDKTIPLP